MDFFYNFFMGYVYVFAYGEQIERFLNLVSKEEIYIWNLKKLNSESFSFCVSLRGFKKLRKPAFITKTKLKIKRKSGIYPYKKKIKRRKFLLAGIPLSILIIMIINSFILKIEIIGNTTVKTEEILDKLNQINLHVFSPRFLIDSDEISVKLITESDNISWVGVYEKGSKLIIDIKERKLPPKSIPLHIPCHIIAKKSGVIRKMTTENGEPLVKIGEPVEKGQVLVSGIISTRYDGMRYVHSISEIIADTWYDEAIDVKLYRYDKIYTGKKTNRYKIKLFSKEISLAFKKDIPYYNYKTDSKRYVFGFFELDEDVFKEYNLKKVKISREEAIKNGRNSLLSLLRKKYKKEEIKNYSFSEEQIDEETYKVKIFATLLENIGESYEIEKGN